MTVAILAAALGLAMPLAANSAGLGRITVLSPLGQPLNAEIEIVTHPGDEDLVATLASSEAFRNAGIVVNPALSSARMRIVRRDGRQFLHVTTRQPISEPFLELLVDLQWNSGRLLREYTVLLDPPEYQTRQAIAAAPAPATPQRQAVPMKPKPPAMSGVEAKPLPPEAPPATISPTQASAGEPPAADTPTSAPAPAPLAEASAAAPTARPAAPASGVEVKRGDTLGAIARQYLPDGVTLNQMLIALFRSNEDAFIRGNMNLVRAGRILNVPEPDIIGTVDRAEATRLVREQYAEFNAYRGRLAAAPAAAEQADSQRDVSGAIEAKSPEIATTETADQVKLSQADPQGTETAATQAAREDDRVARERELQEAQSRVTDLEKTVADLQKLLEIQSQQLNELQTKAQAQPQQPAPPVVPAATAASEKAASPMTAPAPGPASQPKAESPAPQAQAPSVAQPAKPPAQAQKPRPKPAPPLEQRSPLDDYLEDPMLVGGAGLIVLLLIAYGISSWRRKRAAQSKFEDSVVGAAAAGGAAGEPGVAASVSQASVSQAPAGMEAEEVDPIAEADVYIAYGRDSQAEEILNEALQKDPERAAVHAKLLEIYANRKDTRSFEQTALRLKSITGGSGADWEKAVALGRSIDPQNGLYGGAGSSAAAGSAAPVAAAAVAAPALDFDLGGTSQGGAPAPDISFDEPQKDPTESGIDLDLETVPAGAETDLAHMQTAKLPALDTADTAAGGIDFNVDMGEARPAAAVASAEESGGGLDFDLKLDDLGGSGDERPAAPAMDLSAISLDLDTAEMPAQGAASPKWQEVTTKLDLAKAYEEMGDMNGARELLNEVVKDGDASQKGQAEELLAKLG